MALNIYTPFTADRSVLAGGQALGAGLGGGLASLGEGIGQMMEKKKQRNARAKASEALFKATPELQQAVGLDADDFSALSADDKTETIASAVAGLKLRSELAAATRSKRLDEMRLAEALAQQQQPASILQALQEQQAEGMEPGEAMAGRGPLDDAGFDASMARRAPGANPMALAILEGSARSGAGIPPQVLDDLIRQGASEGVDWESIQPREGRTAAGESYLYGKGGQFQFSPGTERFTPPKQAGVIVSQDPLTGEPRVTWSGSPEDFSKQFPGAKMPAVEKGAGPDLAPLPMPKTKAELKANQRYQTPRGVATWDGTKFVME